jgi:ribosome-binding factor A
MPKLRQQRINDRLREELTLLVPGRLDDPRLADVQITRVETTQDLSTAKVYVTNFDPEESVDDLLRALDRAQGALRAELALVGLRRLPHLVFTEDRDYEEGERVLHLLDRLHDPGTGEVAGDAGDPSTGATGGVEPPGP